MISGYYTALERTLFLGEPDPASLALWEANVAAHGLRPRPDPPRRHLRRHHAAINAFFAERDLLRFRSFGYGHSFGLLSHYYGREAGLELREDVETVLAPGMVISMEPMLTPPPGTPGAGGYREHDILVVTAEAGREHHPLSLTAPHTTSSRPRTVPDRQATRAARLTQDESLQLIHALYRRPDELSPPWRSWVTCAQRLIRDEPP